MSDNLGPSFGIELEFILIRPRSQHAPDEIDCVQDALKRPFRIACNPGCCSTVHEYSLPLNDCIGGHLGHSGWTVAIDETVELDDAELADLPISYTVAGMELVSRVFHLGEDHQMNIGSHLHADPDKPLPWRYEIRAVLQRLHSAFNKPGSNTRIVINKSCGFHVHVGQDDRGLPVDTIVNTMAMYTGFEREIDTMMDVSRIGSFVGHLDEQSGPSPPGDLKHNQHCTPMSFLFLTNWWQVQPYKSEKYESIRWRLPDFPADLAEHDNVLHTAMNSFEVHAWLYIINKVRNSNDIYLLYSTEGHACALNPANLVDPYQGVSPTLEFRQHAGTLDAGEILSWIEFCVRLTNYCHTFSRSQVMEFAADRFRGAWSTFLNLCVEIGVEPDTLRFFHSVLQDDYAENRFQRIIHNASRGGDGGPLLHFTGALEQRRRDCRAQAAVNDKIRRKFLVGGYGMYPRSFVLDFLGPALADSALGRRVTLALDAEPGAVAADWGEQMEIDGLSTGVAGVSMDAGTDAEDGIFDMSESDSGSKEEAGRDQIGESDTPARSTNDESSAEKDEIDETSASMKVESLIEGMADASLGRDTTPVEGEVDNDEDEIL